MFKKSIIPSLIMTSMLALPAWAEDDHDHSVHEADINPYRVGAEIMLDSQLFESDFGDLGGGAFSTDAPGIDADTSKGTFTSGNWLQFKALEALQFWDGEDWSTTMPNGEYINIVDAQSNTLRIDATEPSGSSMAVIGEIDANGGIHTHINFNLMDASNSQNGTVGAYRIELKLLETAANSEVSVSYAAKPVVIVFNQGLTTEKFEEAVAALAGEVEYNSTTGMLVIPEVEALGKHYKATLQNQGDYVFKLISSEEVSGSDSHDH